MRNATQLQTPDVAATLPSDVAELPTSNKIELLVRESWSQIAPSWPLQNLIAVNPLAGLEDLDFAAALREGQALFQQADLPTSMQAINRESIKWLQAFFDAGQATLGLPLRTRGLLGCVLALLPHDQNLRRAAGREWALLRSLPTQPTAIIATLLLRLGVPRTEQARFLTLLLTTLPGWAAYVKYRTDWPDAADARHPHAVSAADYLALRLVLTALLWPQAKELLGWHAHAKAKADVSPTMAKIEAAEKTFRQQLLEQLKLPAARPNNRPQAQLVFCIDVRSEPFRRALESLGTYETFGFAGFFGVPVNVHNPLTGGVHASCPVLLKPALTVREQLSCPPLPHLRWHARRQRWQQLYQALKYNLGAPFSLVEALGGFSALWLACRNWLPRRWQALQQQLQPAPTLAPELGNIPLDQQIAWAAGALQGMGLTAGLAPLVVLCGHGGESQNNAYVSALDCGACGGHRGAPNARILAAILNQPAVATALRQQGLAIPDDTYFLAAEHNTTTDDITLFAEQVPSSHQAALASLQADLAQASVLNRAVRAPTLSTNGHTDPRQRAADWAQVRPEWGLAGNGAFIVGPRALTASVNLQGRAFLHSYEWQEDSDGSILTTILTAPMVVAQWINAQYLFSTLDNVAFGGGSKVTKNVVGKIGIMQGNASDLMHGLPLQSVYADDRSPYHQPVRLLTVVLAPPAMLQAVVQQQPILQKLFGNGWVSLVCLDPQSGEKLQLQPDFSWQPLPH